MTIGEKIHLYRKQAGLSQEELADKLNVTRQSISLWETDQTVPSLDSLILLTEIFRVGLDELCGTQPTSDAESVQANGEADTTPTPPESAERLAYAETKYTPELLKSVGKTEARKIFIINIVGLIISVIWSIWLIASDADKMYLIITLFFAVVFAAIIIWIIISSKNRAAEFLKLNPNCIAQIKFFRDYLEVDTVSDNTDSKLKINYCDVKKVINDEKFILIFCGSSIVPIEKEPDADYKLILKLLNVPIGDTNTPDNKKIKTLLLTMFIASLLSIFLAMLIAVICVRFSPLPDFEYTFLEHMWILLVFLPLPLASAVLGIVFFIKKYKCKKNIIAGFIMCVLLSVFGSFPFMFKDYTMHDFGYVKEVEQLADIELPDSGFISRAKNISSTVRSVAMIKFDDQDEIFDIIRSDDLFEFSPNGTGTYYQYEIVLPEGYPYYRIFYTEKVVSGGIYGPDPRYLYMLIAYNPEKNILFVLEFLF